MSKEELITAIQIDRANLEYIATTGKINGSLLVDIRKAMTEYAHRAIEEAAEAANIRYTSCGDPMTCACQGTCDHLMAHIDKKSILKLKEKY